MPDPVPAPDPHGQRLLAPSAFPADTGQADPRTRSALALALSARTPESYLAAVAALCLDRVLVPVVATATDVAAATRPDGTEIAVDKEADMAVVTVADQNGRRALLAFSGLDALQAWESRARPVPVTLDLAARAATDDGAEALLIDVAGPSPTVIEGEVLQALARGHRLVALDDGGFGWAVPATELSPSNLSPTNLSPTNRSPSD